MEEDIDSDEMYKLIESFHTPAQLSIEGMNIQENEAFKTARNGNLGSREDISSMKQQVIQSITQHEAPQVALHPEDASEDPNRDH